MTCRVLSVIALLIPFLAGCGEQPAPPADTAPPSAATATEPAPVAPAESVPPPVVETPGPHVLFWSRLTTLCDRAYAGYLTVGTEESDRRFGEAELMMHVLHCGDDEIRIAFHVDDDRSRTFILRRADDGLTLHHRHREEDGSPADPDGYGGATAEPGTAARQEFIVDAATVAALQESKYNVWSIEIEPDNYLAYELKRVEEERYFRVEFELEAPILTPPLPWGE